MGAGNRSNRVLKVLTFLGGGQFVVSTYEECITRHEENENADIFFKEFATGWKASLGYKDETDYLRFFE